MKYLLQTEELIQFIVSIIALYYLPIHLSLWIWIILFLLPDIGMIGYLVNTRVGAITYNIFHHKGIALIILAIGFFTASIWIEVAGIVLFGHSSMDRVIGYGLKYADSFKHTHLGWLPQKQADIAR